VLANIAVWGLEFGGWGCRDVLTTLLSFSFVLGESFFVHSEALLFTFCCNLDLFFSIPSMKE
jgi:hypothetical protein